MHLFVRAIFLYIRSFPDSTGSIHSLIIIKYLDYGSSLAAQRNLRFSVRSNENFLNYFNGARCSLSGREKLIYEMEVLRNVSMGMEKEEEILFSFSRGSSVIYTAHVIFGGEKEECEIR